MLAISDQFNHKQIVINVVKKDKILDVNDP